MCGSRAKRTPLTLIFFVFDTLETHPLFWACLASSSHLQKWLQEFAKITPFAVHPSQ